MQTVFIIIVIIVAVIILWVITTRRRLMILDGNVKDAETQLEIQLSAHLDALNNLSGTVQSFENMVRTSRLIYNDSVTKLNREIRMWPTSMIAGILGFHEKEQLIEQSIK